MPQCPVCDREYIEGETQRCNGCGWDVTPTPGSKYSKVRKAFVEKQQIQLDWARKMWVRYQIQKEELHQKQMPENNTEPQVGSRLESRFDELRSQLDRAKEERAYLQSQLDWVLYRLEQVNLEHMQQVLFQISDWLNGAQTANEDGSDHNYNYYLNSEVGIDYTNLMNLLASGNWQKANEETWQLMLKAGDRAEKGWLSVEELEYFPRTDLATINWLWEHYSYSRFGLGIQQQIWESVETDYSTFCDRVGWRIGENWLYYDELNFSLDAAEGHLPAIAWRKRACYGVGNSTAQESLEALFRAHSVNS